MVFHETNADLSKKPKHKHHHKGAKVAEGEAKDEAAAATPAPNQHHNKHHKKSDGEDAAVPRQHQQDSEGPAAKHAKHNHHNGGKRHHGAASEAGDGAPRQHQQDDDLPLPPAADKVGAPLAKHHHNKHKKKHEDGGAAPTDEVAPTTPKKGEEDVVGGDGGGETVAAGKPHHGGHRHHNATDAHPAAKHKDHKRQHLHVQDSNGGITSSDAPVEAAATHAPQQQQGGTVALASRLLMGKGNVNIARQGGDGNRTLPPHAPTSLGDYAPSDFNNIDYDVAVERYENDYVKQVLKADIEQSSNRFTDYEERPNNGVLLPTGNVDDLLERFGVEQGGVVGWCDPQDADFRADTDDACMQYLTHLPNMLSIKPMASILSTGRTIKFKVFYRHNHTQAVIKVSQKKFVLEPSSEVMAFHTDRVLGILRVPPAAWAPLPVDFLKAAAASMDAFYVQWFQKFVLDYEQVKPLKSTNCFVGRGKRASSGGCLNVSIQLWLADVHPAEESSVSPPRKYRAALELLNTSSDDSKAARHAEAAKDLASRSGFRLAVGELANQFLFDFIIGNSDRWFGHNSFALGGCSSEKCFDDYRKRPWMQSRSSARLAFIDQGSSFYGRSGPEMNPFTKNVGSLCRFNAATASRLLEMIPPGPAGLEAGGKTPQKPGYALYKHVKDRLPKGIFYVASSYLLKAAGTRAERVAKQVRDCLSNFTKSDVLYF